jgi:hypothetical protein
MLAMFWVTLSQAHPGALHVLAELPRKTCKQMAHQLASVQHSDLNIAGEELFRVQGT